MATVDPADSLRKAVGTLTQAINKQNELLQAQQAPTQGLRIAQEQNTAAPGEPAWATARGSVISEPPKISPTQEAGELSKYASRGSGWERIPGQEQMRRAPKPSELSREEAAEEHPNVTGMTRGEVSEAQHERLFTPQYGRFKLQNYLEIARDFALRERPSTNEAGEEEMQMRSPGTAAFLNKALGYATPIAAGRQVVEQAHEKWQQLNEKAQGVVGEGAALGFSPQNAPSIPFFGGGRFGPGGIPNPLALFSSAGRQAMGSKINALEEIFGGNINYQQASALREALAREGFSNQNAGGFLGATVGGEQENLARALAPHVEEGGSPNVIAGFSSAVRYTGTISELSKSLKGLGTTAKTLKMGIDETAESMQSYAKQMEGQGGIPVRSLEHAKEITGMTGLPAGMVTQIASSPLGEALGASKGVFPGTIGSQGGLMQTQVALEAVQQGLGGRPGHATYVYNPLEKREEQTQSAQEQAIAETAAIYFPGVDPQAILRLHNEAGKIKMAGYLQNPLHKEIQTKEQTGPAAWLSGKQGFGPHPYIASRINTLKSELQQGGHADQALKEQELSRYEGEAESGAERRPESKVQAERYDFYSKHPKQTLEALEPLTKHGSMSEARRIYGEAYAADKGGPKSRQKLLEDLEEAQKPKTEKKGEEIGLTPEARKFFELVKKQNPNAANEARAGGPSTASKAGEPNQHKDSVAETALHGAQVAGEKIGNSLPVVGPVLEAFGI